MLQVTKGLTTKLTIPIDYINNVDGEKTRRAFTWDAGDEILVYLKHKKTLLGYEATTSESGAIEFELSGAEALNKYDVNIIFTRGGKSFNCYVGTLQIIDKATPDFNTLNGVYIYADDDTIKFIKAYDGERKASIAELNAALEQAQQNGGGGGGGVADLCINITYAELKAKRDGGKLVAGLSYRITDYTTTTTQENTAAAGHDFDVIVTALDAHTLSEDAHAALRAGDQYFKDCNLAAWRLRYALDMDGARFGWVATPASISFVYEDTTITLYRAPELDDDEAGAFAWVDPDGDPLFTLAATPTQGDALYAPDGEEMEFTVNSYTPPQAPANGKGVIYYMEDEHGNAAPYDFKNIQFSRDAAMLYTFSLEDGGNILDSSINGVMCKGNVINPCFNGNTRVLNDIVIHDIADETPEDYGVINNAFGFGCQKITMGKKCHNNTFAGDCNNIVMGEAVTSNVFGKGCYNINATSAFAYNNIGAGCHNMTFGYSIVNNIIGQHCESVTFGNTCTENVLSAACQEIEFSDSCAQNVIGAKNANIKLHDYCTSIYTGSSVSNLEIERHTTRVEVKAGVGYVLLKSNDSTTSSKKLQNVVINSSVKGTRTSTITVTVSAGNQYTTTVGSANDAKINV